MSRIALRRKLIAIAVTVPAVAAIAFVPVGAAFAGAHAGHAIVADGPVPPVPPSEPVVNNRCPTCL
jgi:hypothetical protein